MRSQRTASPGRSRSVREVFCSVSSAPRSPSPTKQELYELLQRHRMHSFSRRLKSYNNYRNPDAEIELPSYMKQTCSSLIKRMSSKSSRGRTMSPSSSKLSWSNERVLPTEHYNFTKKDFDRHYHETFPTSEPPGSNPFRISPSTIDAAAVLMSAEVASSSSNYECFEEDNKYQNENAVQDKSPMTKRFLQRQISEALDDGESLRHRGVEAGSNGLSNSSFDSEYRERGTSLETVLGDMSQHAIVDEHFIKDFMSSGDDGKESISEESIDNDFSETQSDRRVSVKEPLFSSGPDEQRFSFGTKSEQSIESGPSDSDHSLQSSSSSSLLKNMFCSREPTNMEVMRGVNTPEFKASISSLHLSSYEADDLLADIMGEGSISGQDKMIGGSHRRPIVEEDNIQDRRNFVDQVSSLSSGSSIEEDNKFIDHSNGTAEANTAYQISSRKSHSSPRLGPSSLHQQTDMGFDAKLLELEVSQLELQSSSRQQNSPQFIADKKDSELTQMESIEGVRRLDVVVPTVIYEETESEESDDSSSELESVFFVETVQPRSLVKEPTNPQRPLTADSVVLSYNAPGEKVHFLDDHASILSKDDSPKDLTLGELCIRLDQAEQDKSSCRKQSTSEKSDEAADYLETLDVRDHPAEILVPEKDFREAKTCKTLTVEDTDTIPTNDIEQLRVADAEIQLHEEDLLSSSGSFPNSSVRLEQTDPDIVAVVKHGEETSHRRSFSGLFRSLSERASKSGSERRRRFRFSIKSCFGCSALSPVHEDTDSSFHISYTDQSISRKNKKRRNKSALS